MKTINDIINKYSNEGEFAQMSYDTLKQMLKDCHAIGWTFDYGLDGVPYDFERLINIGDTVKIKTQNHLSENTVEGIIDSKYLIRGHYFLFDELIKV